MQKYLSLAYITSNDEQNDFLRHCLIVVFESRKQASQYAYDNLRARFSIDEHDPVKRDEALLQMKNFVGFLSNAALHMAYLNNAGFFASDYRGSLGSEMRRILVYLRAMPSKASILPLYPSIMTRWHEEHSKSRVIDMLKLLEVLNFRVHVLPGVSARSDSGQGSVFTYARLFYLNKDWKSASHPDDPWITEWNVYIQGDVFDWLQQVMIEYTLNRCNDRKLVEALTLDENESLDFYRWGQGLRYFLANFEESLWATTKQSWEVDQILRTQDALGPENQNDYLSIEHIWASNNRAEDFPDRHLQKRRLGNFALLGIGFNKSLKDIDIPEKVQAMADFNGKNRGAITLFQVAALEKLVAQSIYYLDNERNWSRKTKNYFLEMAMKIADLRETAMINFALTRWAVPMMASGIRFRGVDTFATWDDISHNLIDEASK